MRLQKMLEKEQDLIYEGYCINKKKLTVEEAAEELNKVKLDYLNEMKELEKNKHLFKHWTNSCFVVFNSIADCQKYFELFPSSMFRYIKYIFKRIFKCKFLKAKGKNGVKWIKSFKVEKAPEPEDVFWENFIYNGRDRLMRRSLTLFLTICLSFLNFGIILALNYADVRNSSFLIIEI